MVVVNNKPFSGRVRQAVLAVTVAMSVCAAVAAAPMAGIGNRDATTGVVKSKLSVETVKTSVRALGEGPALRVGRVYETDDEDCLITVTQYTDEKGRFRVKHGVSCN